MDQSKEDQALREKMLVFAVNLEAAAGPEGMSNDALHNARGFYLFVTGRDPLVDSVELPYGPQQPSAEVIDMRTRRVLDTGHMTIPVDLEDL